jgi:predicted HAD superfamily phosphohydrolase
MRAFQLVTDCEGPLALNDNAFELCRDFIKPDGDKFFRQVSRYNDYLADLQKKPDHKAGDTLKLILPFLKAYGLTNAQLLDYSRKNIILMPGAAEAYKFLHGQKFPIFEISTSYRQFAEAVGTKLGFDASHIFCTELDLDRYPLSPGEGEELQRLKGEIAGAPEIELPPDAASLQDLPGPVQEAIGKLDRIFWEMIPKMDMGVIYREVNPLGGPEKAQALGDILKKTGISMADTIYVGDGNTDVQAFQAAKSGGGLGISFNGNRSAVNAAQVVVVSDSAWPIALLTAIFSLWGKEGVLELAAGAGKPGGSRHLVIPEAVIEPIAMGLQGRLFNLYPGDSPNRDKVAQESAAMRTRLRGAALAALG